MSRESKAGPLVVFLFFLLVSIYALSIIPFSFVSVAVPLCFILLFADVLTFSRMGGLLLICGSFLDHRLIVCLGVYVFLILFLTVTGFVLADVRIYSWKRDASKTRLVLFGIQNGFYLEAATSGVYVRMLDRSQRFNGKWILRYPILGRERSIGKEFWEQLGFSQWMPIYPVVMISSDKGRIPLLFWYFDGPSSNPP